MSNPAGDGLRKFYFVLNDLEQRYCLYALSESEVCGASEYPEGTVAALPEPILRLDRAGFPDFMSFAAVGSRIYMVGGLFSDRSTQPPTNTKSDKVFGYDCVSSVFFQAPSLNSAKVRPLLFSIGFKIFALSDMIYSSEGKNPMLDRKPRFEVLDTCDPDCGWTPLRVPDLCVTRRSFCYTVEASVAYGCFIFISVSNAGSYVYDVVENFWKHLSSDQLPFKRATYVSDPQPMCYGYSVQTGKFSAYRIHYEPDSVYSIDEIEIHKVGSSSGLPSMRTFQDCSFCVTLGDNMVYFIMGGLDKPAFSDEYDPSDVSRYIKINGADICIKKRRKKSKKHNRHGKMALERCSSQMGELDEVKDESGKEGVSCGSRDYFRMTPLWRAIYYAGPMTNMRIHITAVFVM